MEILGKQQQVLNRNMPLCHKLRPFFLHRVKPKWFCIDGKNTSTLDRRLRSITHISLRIIFKFVWKTFILLFFLCCVLFICFHKWSHKCIVWILKAENFPSENMLMNSRIVWLHIYPRNIFHAENSFGFSSVHTHTYTYKSMILTEFEERKKFHAMMHCYYGSMGTSFFFHRSFLFDEMPMRTGNWKPVMSSVLRTATSDL